FFNWYDTKSLAPLAPLYVSTVDSGNLLGYLMTLASTLPAMVDTSPLDVAGFRDGLSDTLALFERDGLPALSSLGRERSRDFRTDVRRLHSRLDEAPPD